MVFLLFKLKFSFTNELVKQLIQFCGEKCLILIKRKIILSYITVTSIKSLCVFSFLFVCVHEYALKLCLRCKFLYTFVYILCTFVHTHFPFVWVENESLSVHFDGGRTGLCLMKNHLSTVQL